MMEAVRTSETSVDNHFTRQYNPEDSSEHLCRLFIIIIMCREARQLLYVLLGALAAKRYKNAPISSSVSVCLLVRLSVQK
jgi:hypothetical protein